MMRKFLLLSVFWLSFGLLYAQQPSITNIDPVNAYPSSTVRIAGSGFGTNAANIKVWFGGVEGAVSTITDNLIEVIVPPQAPSDNITVLNTSNGLLDMSNEKFFVSHSGTAFDISQLSTPYEYFNSSTEELFDLCTGDFDNDGKPDIATTVTSGDTEIKLLKNTSTIGNVSFTEFDATDFSVFNVGLTLRNIGCADLNGDGNLDIFVSRNGQEKVYIFENTNSTPGTMSFTKPAIEINMTANTVPYQPIRLEAQDLNGDGKPELIVSNNGEGTINILINESNGGISFNPTQQIIQLSGLDNTAGLSVEDMDGDGRPDIVLTKLFASGVYILRNSGAGSVIDFEAPYSINTSGASVNVTTADYNNDGLLDFAVVDLSNAQIQIFENTSSSGSLSFATSSVTNIATGSEPWVARAGDMNGDGLLDVVITSRQPSKYTVAINNGGLNFTAYTVAVPRNTRNANVSDYDGDGKPDIAITSFVSGDYALQVIRNSNCYSPVILNETPLTICNGQTKTLAVPDAPGATFNWKKDAVLQKSGPENFLDITVAGNYDIEVSSEGGSCINTASISVTTSPDAPPTDPLPTNNGPTCIGGDITLSVPTVTGATYSWTGPNGFTSTQQNPTITGVTTDNAGVYSVVIEVGPCSSSAGSTTVVVQEPPTFTASASGATTICSGSTVSLSTQNVAGYSYQWMLNGTDITSATSNTFSANTTGSYSVRVSEIAGNCEVITNAVDVTVLTIPVVDFTVSGSTCTGSDITFTSTSTTDANATVAYDWNFGDGTTNGTTDTEIHNYASASSYTVQLTVSYTAAAGCSPVSATQTVNVVNSEPLTIQAAQSYICPDSTVDLSIPTTFSNIVWSTGESTPTITALSASNYTVNASDVNGCNVTDTYALAAGTATTVSVTANGNQGDISIVEGDQVQLAATGANSYSWSPIDFLDDATIATPVATPTTTTAYTVTGFVAGQCPGVAQLNIAVTPQGDINITPLRAFSPNSTIDPTWRVDNVESYPDCTMSIYDERGTLIYRKKGYNNDWDATYNGTPLPEGVYYFVFNCTDLKPYSGSILVIR